MDLIESIYLILGCIFLMIVFRLYIKYLRRKLPSMTELILLQQNMSEGMLILNNESMAIVNKRKRELDSEMKGLLRDYDEPDKTFH